MIPGAKDCDYWRGEEPFTAAQIKAFKEAYDDYGFIDKHHQIRDINSAKKDDLIGSALKSFILQETTSYTWFDGSVHTYPAGTWMLTSQIDDPVAIKAVKDGLITGYSPSVFRRETAERIRAALKSACKSSAGGLIKDIKDPVPVLVSLVRKPCQHGNRFCKNNIVGEDMSEDTAQSKLKEIKQILGFDKPEFATKEDLDEIKESMKGDSDAFKEEMKTFIQECISEALAEPAVKEDKPADEKVDEPAVKADEKPEDEEEKPADEEENSEEEEEEKPATKGDSKAMPLHDTGDDKPAMKSDSAIVFDIMGRTTSGRPKRN